MSLNIDQIINNMSNAMQAEFSDNWAVSHTSIQEVLAFEKESLAELLQLHTDGELDLAELKSELEDVLLVIENNLLAKAIANKVTVKKALDLALNVLLSKLT